MIYFSLRVSLANPCNHVILVTQFLLQICRSSNPEFTGKFPRSVLTSYLCATAVYNPGLTYMSSASPRVKSPGQPGGLMAVAKLKIFLWGGGDLLNQNPLDQIFLEKKINFLNYLIPTLGSKGIHVIY